MKSSRLLVVATLALAALFTCAVPSGFAKSKKAATDEPAAAKMSTIEAVNATDHTVQVKFKAMKTPRLYRIDDLTHVTLNIAPGKFSDIRVGMEITDLVERDSQTLDKITLQGSGLAPAPPPEKKKAAKKPKAAPKT